MMQRWRDQVTANVSGLKTKENSFRKRPAHHVVDIGEFETYQDYLQSLDQNKRKRLQKQLPKTFAS
jgi:predicted N-acyltransferase